MDADGEHQPVGQLHGFADDIEMAVGDGIERSRKERRSLHGGGLARAEVNRKLRLARKTAMPSGRRMKPPVRPLAPALTRSIGAQKSGERPVQNDELLCRYFKKL